MAYRMYDDCPFQRFGRCGIFLDASGNPVHECVKITCKVWSVVDELDESAYNNAHDAERYEDEIGVLEDKVIALNEKLNKPLIGKFKDWISELMRRIAESVKEEG